ncbi:tetratricopeptide repeat protein [Enterococcus cecorum]|uniref:tetratricopeptide repeat protein n=1 Tax=Enterococcus cecorum TaxID=44008 RepID=UPI000DEB2367|nr:sel1 repeat family protein [Enterococcus cecorum]RBR39286.1 hypothetical protein EB31_00172 [Enterococcus cecorum]
MYIEDMTAEEINRMPKLKYRERMDNELAYQWLFRCFVNEKDYPKTYQIIQNALDHDNDTLYYLNPFEVARRLYWADENQYCPKEIFIFMEKAFRDQLYLLSDPLAADFLGDLFYLPRFRHMNEKKAIKYYTVAAKEGLSNAMARLGILYYRQHRLKKAYPFLLKASMLGDSEVKYQLAELYWYGEGVEQDLFLANKLYQEVQNQKEDSEAKVRSMIRLSQYKRMVAEAEEKFLDNIRLLHKAEQIYFELGQQTAGIDESLEEEINQELTIVKQAIKQRRGISGLRWINVHTSLHELEASLWHEGDIEDLLRLSKSEYFQKAVPFQCPNNQWEALNLIQTKLLDQNIFAIRVRDSQFKYQNEDDQRQFPLVEAPLDFDENKITHYMKNREFTAIVLNTIGFVHFEPLMKTKNKEYRLHYYFENEEIARSYTEEIFEKMLGYAFYRLDAKKVWMGTLKDDETRLEFLRKNGFKSEPSEKLSFVDDRKDVHYYCLLERFWDTY